MAATFSIVVPCYNAERYVRECLDSILQAATVARAEIELICIDDGSHDRTGVILDEAAESHASLRVIHQANGGEGAARNAGLDVATGEWVMFVDADDVIAPSCLAEVAEKIDEYADADLIRFKLTAFQDGASPCWRGDGGVVCVDISHEMSMDIMTFGVTEFAYRRSILAGMRFTALKLGADLVFTRSVFAVASQIVSVDRTLYGYRQVDSSMSHKDRTPALMMDYIDYHIQIFNVFHRTRKAISKSMARVQYNSLLEGAPLIVGGRLWSRKWDGVWQHWLDAVNQIRQLPYFTKWQYFVSGFVVRTHSRVGVFALCVMPARLKRMGLHR